MWAGVITLFPEMFQVATTAGILKRAIDHERLMLHCVNPRDYTKDKHRTVDDKPFSGGPGMLMKSEPLKLAIHAAKAASPTPPRVIYVSPQGKRFDQEAARSLASSAAILFIAGRYEGIDERVIQSEVDEEWSIGDYVLTGGELPVMVMLDAISRFIPDVLGDPESATSDSLANGLLKHPQYTKPAQDQTGTVPNILRSGNHALLNQWKRKASIGQTWLKRPDLLIKRGLSDEELTLLYSFIEEWQLKNNGNIK